MERALPQAAVPRRWHPGPRWWPAGPGSPGPEGTPTCTSSQLISCRAAGVFGILADGTDEIVKAVRFVLREGADAVKIFASGGDNWPHDRNDDVHYSFDEIRACVEEAHQRGTIVMCHAENRAAIELAVEAGCDTIEHGEDIDEPLAAKMAGRGTILVPTLQLIVNWHRDFMPMEPGARSQTRPDAFLLIAMLCDPTTTHSPTATAIRRCAASRPPRRWV